MTAPGIEPALELSIVIPCLDEIETVGRCVEAARGFLIRTGIAGEVVVADNGSTDGSGDVATASGARVVRVEERGYGSALMGGIEAARGRFVVMGDADDSYDFSELDAFVSALRSGSALVMGNRFRGGIQPGAMPLLHRYFGNPVLSAIGRVFFDVSCGDFHCGLRGFDRERILALDLRSRGMEFASEMIVKVSLQGLRIEEVPTVLRPDGRSRPPHLRTWRDGWRHLRFMLLYSPRWLFFYPGAMLMTFGLAASIWLLPGPRELGGVTFDIHTLSFAGAAIMLGFQSVAFAAMSKAFAMREGLLPRDAVAQRWLGRLSLEVALVVGLVCILAGATTAALAVAFWAEHGLGDLEPSRSMRLVVPATTLSALGGQIVLCGFMLALMRLRRD